MCFNVLMVTLFSAYAARWFNRTTVLSVQCYSWCGSFSFLGFGLKTADFSLMESYNRIECFLLYVLTDLFYLSLEVLIRCYFGLRPILWGFWASSPVCVPFLKL